MTSQSPSTRKQCDFTKLLMAGYELELNNGSTQDFFVKFHGPKETSYEGGIWKIHVSLPDDYPFSSPSIGFINKVLHPNVDEVSGSVCLDVINQTWTPLYSLVNIFEVFLPQLLTYPNPTDPLNSDAASLFMRDKEQYEQRITEYVRLYANCDIWDGKQNVECIKGASSSASTRHGSINEGWSNPSRGINGSSRDGSLTANEEGRTLEFGPVEPSGNTGNDSDVSDEDKPKFDDVDIDDL